MTVRCELNHTLQAHPGKTKCPNCGGLLRNETLLERSPEEEVVGGVRKTMLDPLVAPQPERSGAPPANRAAKLKTVVNFGEPTPGKTESCPHPHSLEANPGKRYCPKCGAVLGESEASAGSPPTSQVLPLLAVLVSHTWKPEGEVFLIRGERNRLGRGDLEVSLPHDRTMSDYQATIMIRLKGKRVFTISDNASQNGTFVNDELIEESVPLSNYDRIRAGATQFTFIIVDPLLLPGSSSGGGSPTQ